MLQHQQDLDHTGEAGAGLQMADLGLDRSQCAGPGEGLGRGEDFREGRKLDHVSQRRAGPVSLDEGYRLRAERGLLVGGEDDLALGPDLRHGEGTGRPPVVDRRTREHTVDAVSEGQGIFQGLQQKDRDTFSGDVAVRASVEGSATTRGTEHAGLGKGNEFFGAEAEVDPRRQGVAGLAGDQAFPSLVEGDEGGGVGRVDGQTRTPQSEKEGEAIGQQATAGAEGGVAIDLSL